MLGEGGLGKDESDEDVKNLYYRVKMKGIVGMTRNYSKLKI
jgi:hypothetical protein